MLSAACIDESHGKLPVFEGLVNGRKVKNCLRDTGSSEAVVAEYLIDKKLLYNAKTVHCTLADGTLISAPKVLINIDTPYFTGQTMAVVFKNPPFKLILGNIETCKYPSLNDKTAKSQTDYTARQGVKAEQNDVTRQSHAVTGEVNVTAAITRAGARSKEVKLKPLTTHEEIPSLDITKEELSKLQKEEQDFSRFYYQADQKYTHTSRKSETISYTIEDGILMRHYQSDGMKQIDKVYDQIVVPTKLRQGLIELAHSSLLAGHLSAQKVYLKLSIDFFWKHMLTDIKTFIKSCLICQRVGRCPKKTTLGEVPIVNTPFEMCAIDLIGKINPRSKSGYSYILLMVDYATRYTLTVPLKKNDTISICDGLLEMFSFTGIPGALLTDCATTFTSDIMKEITRIFSIKHDFCIPMYHATSGLVERWIQTCRKILTKLCFDHPEEWDRYLAPVNFVLREIPTDFSNFSPYELLFGRTCKGVTRLLKDIWMNKQPDEAISTEWYVINLISRITETAKLARKNFLRTRDMRKKYYDKHAKFRTLNKGDLVFVLLPQTSNKLLMHHGGPYEVIDKDSNYLYKVQVGDKIKLYHINMLKKFENNSKPTEDSTDVNMIGQISSHINTVIVNHEQPDINEPYLLPSMEQSQTIDDVQICDGLTDSQKQDVKNLLEEFKDVLTDLPGLSKTGIHEIKLTGEIPKKKKIIPTPYALKETMQEEIQKLLRHGFIEPCVSEYCQPVILVKKPTPGTYRLAFDARAINQVTVPEQEEIPNMKMLFDDLKDCKYFTTLDLNQAFYQIELEENSRKYTAFQTGLNSPCYRFVRMCFGLRNSSQTMVRVIRNVLNKIKGCKSYLDDVYAFSVTWEEHMRILRQVFTALRKDNLTAAPIKTKIGFPEIKMVGFIAGQGVKRPLESKIDAIAQTKPPKTVKQLRSILGAMNYYREFIPNYAEKVHLLTERTSKKYSKNIKWTPELEEQFVEIKRILTSKPILKLVDFNKDFHVSSDASDIALSSTLFQEHDGLLFPCYYVSRKLLPREKNYHVSEKETLATVFGLEKFRYYLLGRRFYVHVDSTSLLHINTAKDQKPRIIRWALVLMEYDFEIIRIESKNNNLSDYMSRNPVD